MPASLRIFRADSMPYTFFSSEPQPELAAIGVTYVESPEAADIILARTLGALRPYGHLDARFAVWTHEPRYCTVPSFTTVEPGIGRPVNIMCLYTRNVYTDQFYYFPRQAAVSIDKLMSDFKDKRGGCVMLATYMPNNTDIFMDGLLSRNGENQNIDLYKYRQELGLHLAKQGRIDVFGRKWPNPVAVMGESRIGDWHNAKAEILKRYAINVAIENTRFPFYISEKVWDAVLSACLPVYHGMDNHIYEVLPKGSLIEVDDKPIEQVASEINEMPRSEQMDRYELAARAMVDIIRQNPRVASAVAVRKRAAHFLEGVMATSNETRRSQSVAKATIVPHPKPKSGAGKMDQKVHPRSLDLENLRFLIPRKRPVILEIGANNGQHSAGFMSSFPLATLHCFEPDTRAIRMWRERMGKAPGAHLHETAVGDTNGFVNFHVSGGRDEKFPEGYHASGSIREPKKHLEVYPDITFSTRAGVPIVRLDDWARGRGIGRVDFMWADVQGAEVDLIRGGGDVLSNTCYFYTEYSNRELYAGQVTLDDILALLPDFEIHTRYAGDVLLRNKRFTYRRATVWDAAKARMRRLVKRRRPKL